MFTAWILLMLNSLFFTLRLSGGGSGSFPRPLKAEEERMYLERMAQGDLEARNILIEHNLRLVAHIMKKYYTPNGDQDDLISIGTIGLIKGISTFKPDKNVRLATYASRCIENEILMHFRAQRKLQAGGLQDQTGGARQPPITTNRGQLRHLRLKVVERGEPAGEACGHQTTPGAARRHSSCQRVATLASRSPSSAETLQPP